MKLGFLTALLSDMGIEELFEWAERNNFDCLEIAAWPLGSDKISRYWGTTIDVAELDRSRAGELKELSTSWGVEISSLAYYDNNLDGDPGRRKIVNDHLKKTIRAASLLEVDLVGTFIGPRSQKIGG